jgi:hypothetical protein
MKVIKIAVAVFTLSLFGAMVTPNVRAQDDNAFVKRTKVTFNQPVEIPGRVLAAGTYTMELLGSNSTRTIVRFFNEDRTKIIATVLGIPNLRLKATDKTVMMFEERPINNPEAMKAWVYPGDFYGTEFVYPKRRAIELAEETKEPVLAFAAEPETVPETVERMTSAPLVAETPTREEVEVSEVVEAPVLVAQAETLPRTASPVPLIALMGMASLGAAFAAKRFATRRS